MNNVYKNVEPQLQLDLFIYKKESIICFLMLEAGAPLFGLAKSIYYKLTVFAP